MKNKRILFLLILVLIIILIFIFIIVKNFTNLHQEQNDDTYNEYTPEEEISSSQLRQTIVTLYFLDENNNLKSEGKLIDSTELVQNPYKKIVELLLQGSQNSSYSTPFPEGTQILDAQIEKTCVTLNFSEELLNFENDDQKYNIINCLLNTLSELNEVFSIKIQINGESTDIFPDEYWL